MDLINTFFDSIKTEKWKNFKGTVKNSLDKNCRWNERCSWTKNNLGLLALKSNQSKSAVDSENGVSFPLASVLLPLS